MWKKISRIIIISLIVILFLGTAIFLYLKSAEKPVVYRTVTPFKTDIIKKTVATGSIVPKKEIAVKSRTSGIIKEIFVEPGNTVEEGELLASLTIIPNMVNLNSAESNLNKARINLRDANKELKRHKLLFEKGAISEFEYNKIVLNQKIAQEDFESAKNNLQLIKEGATDQQDQVSNLIYAPTAGKILDVPVKQGRSVIESNNFNEGTTIALIADMDDLEFRGNLDESEVGKLHEGMDILITIAAIENEIFNAKLDYISPKGVDVQGAIQFEVKASIKDKKGKVIRSGYSANADIVLERVDNVIAINESNIIFEKNKTFVEIETKPQEFQKKEVEIGLSDGINIEIKSGLTLKDKIKVQIPENKQK